MRFVCRNKGTMYRMLFQDTCNSLDTAGEGVRAATMSPHGGRYCDIVSLSLSVLLYGWPWFIAVIMSHIIPIVVIPMRDT